MPLSFSTPLSMYSIPIAWVTMAMPYNRKPDSVEETQDSILDRITPRAVVQWKQELQKQTDEFMENLQRIGAKIDGHDVLSLYIGAIVAGNFAGLSHRTLNFAAFSFLSARITFNYFYMDHLDKTWEPVRSFAWTVSVGVPLYLFVKSANAISGSRSF